MKRKAIVAIILMGFAVLFQGCASMQYRKAAIQVASSNPHAALEYISLSLQKSPSDSETRRLLDDVLKAISREHEACIERLRNDKNYETAVAECDRVIASAYYVRSFPGGNIVLYYEERNRAELSELAAEKNYKLGTEYELQKKNREAATAYCMALGFRATYKDAEKRRDAMMDAAMTRLYIKGVETSNEREFTQAICLGLGPAALQERPRYLKIVGDETNATTLCSVSVQPVNEQDTGWVSKAGRADPTFIVTDQYGNKKKIQKHATWTVYSREISCRMSGGFSTEVKNQVQALAAPGGNASYVAADSGKYAECQGDMDAVPKDIQSLPGDPPVMKDKETLRSECVRGIIGQLGNKLFLAYK